MCKYNLGFYLGTSDEHIYLKFLDEIRNLITDYSVEEIDYKLSQRTRTEVK